MLREIVSLQVMSKDEYVGKEVFQSRKIQDYLKAKDQDIKIKLKDIKLKIKIQDHKHAKGSLKEFSRTQGSKIQNVTRNDQQVNDHPLGRDC
ncbi:hypothetical protein Tco_0229101 [Tanacetum coccineum]